MHIIYTIRSFAIHDLYIRFGWSLKFQAMSISSEDSPLYGTKEVSSGYESFILKKGEKTIVKKINILKVYNYNVVFNRILFMNSLIILI